MAPIESSQRALFIGAIEFAQGDFFNNEKVDNDFPISHQMKSWKKGVKSNQVTKVLKRLQI